MVNCDTFCEQCAVQTACITNHITRISTHVKTYTHLSESSCQVRPVRMSVPSVLQQFCQQQFVAWYSLYRLYEIAPEIKTPAALLQLTCSNEGSKLSVCFQQTHPLHSNVVVVDVGRVHLEEAR